MTAPQQRRVEWRYTFCDLLTRRPLARLPLVDADLAEIIGGPAEGTGKVPISNAKIRARDPWAATTPRRTLCFAQRVVYVEDRKVAEPALWAGIVWKRVRSGTNLSLAMATVESYWRMRLLARDRTFSQDDDGEILRALLADAEAVPNGALGIDLGTDLVGTLSDRTVVAADLKSVLETATSVATAGGGMDWRIVPGYTPETGFTLSLRMADNFGRTDVTNRTWQSRPDGRPGNELIGYEMTEDGTAVPNRVIGLGAGQGPDQMRSTAIATEDGWPLLETSLGSATQDLITQAALDRHTSTELAKTRARERQITSMTVRGDRGATVDTYGLGDAVGLKLRDPLHREPYTHVGRIVGRRILPNQPGRNETVAMTLGPAVA